MLLNPIKRGKPDRREKRMLCLARWENGSYSYPADSAVPRRVCSHLVHHRKLLPCGGQPAMEAAITYVSNQ